MIPRNLSPKIIQLYSQYPVLALLGPRQSGKTTLVKHLFPQYTYVSLEDLDTREFAKSDPRGFLKTNKNSSGIIIDEVQRVPELLSYIQSYVDNSNKPGEFILTGSQNFLIHQALSQTLAGRIAILTLLPLTIGELAKQHKLPMKATEAIFNGFYPRIFTNNFDPNEWYANYIQTYVEKDVRLIQNIPDLFLFQKFLKLCAGRIGQLIQFSSLGNDCGIDQRTVKSWLSILEMSYVIFLLPPHFENFNKRLVKMPKIYFYDTGLASALLGITSPKQLNTHYLKGGLFECMIISDLVKQKYNRGKVPNLHFWRDHHGHEIDCLWQQDNKTIPIEIKSGETISSDYFNGLSYWSTLINTTSNIPPSKGLIIYSGEAVQEREKGRVIGWKALSENLEKFES